MQKKRSDVFSKNTKAQGLSVNAIILIILGLVVLVILILGFTIGWGTILPFVKTNNIRNIVTACENACSTESQYDFCSAPREVSDGVNDKFTDTCFNLADLTDPGEKYAGKNYGIKKCPAIICTSSGNP